MTSSDWDSSEHVTRGNFTQKVRSICHVTVMCCCSNSASESRGAQRNNFARLFLTTAEVISTAQVQQRQQCHQSALSAIKAVTG